jgi:uncharacterized protein (DUF1778 family)
MPNRHSDEHEVLTLIPGLEELAPLNQAVALQRTGANGFVVDSAMRAAADAVDRGTRISLLDRKAMMLMELLKNSPAPSDKVSGLLNDCPNDNRWN